ncbi:MAG: 3'(2'),5'-bisphosphate nucleotidase CysQ [Myxococcota bacterium]|nr:3'(2'),5'-bisphosphate nucleotidase CysQ [Deltaproteobacteria bacterium]MDQ3337428.1 3'(2'),5'-bisphosphate nucleotidase CysQ [Myxococcota bacterium]
MLPGIDGVLGAELRCAFELARKAGAEVAALQKGIEVEMKPGDEPVTAADRRASEIIVAGLASAFPDDPVISEELPPPPGAQASARLWLVDPIDGTKDFIRGEDGYSVMIGLVRDGKPALGVVYQPAQDRMFYAVPEGAWIAIGAHVEAMQVSKVAVAGDARLVASKSHRGPDIDRVKERLGIKNEENVGSVGVKLCLIALGVHDLYVNPAAKTKAWDTCAPEAILVRAGGRLSDLYGGPIDYRGDLAHRRGLVASNGHVHAEVLSRLAPLFPQN